MHWELHNTIIFSKDNDTQQTDKYACFDLDGTIICPKSGSKYVKHKEDWEFKFKTTADILRKYHLKKYKIVIFTNQAGIKLIGIDNWKEMICNIRDKLGLNIDVHAAMNYDLYRKPFPTMWTMFVNGRNVDNKSFYCGDACGRENDFSDSDYKFALNCNLKFYTPEELFKNTKYIVMPRILYKIDFKKYLLKSNIECNTKKMDIIVLVGNYASGKTHFANKYLIPNGYISVKSIDEIKANIVDNNSIVIDNINLTIFDRTIYIKLAKHYNYSCRCINIVCPISLAIHNSRYRHYMSNGKCNIISDDIICQYKDRFEYPTNDEGFDEIMKYNFSIDTSCDISKYFLFLF
jgi:bifunctional polynucleotide phosphatase/kinase